MKLIMCENDEKHLEQVYVLGKEHSISNFIIIFFSESFCRSGV